MVHHTTPPDLVDGANSGPTPENWTEVPAHAASLEGQGARVQMLANCYREAAQQDDEEFQSVMHDLIEAEYALDEATLRTYAEARVHAWLALAPPDRERVVGYYTAYMGAVEAEVALRRVAAEQPIIGQLSADDQATLQRISPLLFNERVNPPAVTLAGGESDGDDAAMSATPEEQRYAIDQPGARAGATSSGFRSATEDLPEPGMTRPE